MKFCPIWEYMQKNYDKVVEVADVFTPIWLIRGTNLVQARRSNLLHKLTESNLKSVKN